MRPRRVRLGVTAAGVWLALVAFAATAVGHPSHVTPTPTGPLAGGSSAGIAIGLTGVVLVSAALLLANEGVLTDRARGAGIGVGAALVIVGGAVSVLVA